MTPGAGKFPWKTVIKIVVSAGFMVFLLQRISLEDLMALVRGLDRRALAAAVVCFLVSNVIGSYQWYRLLRASGITLSFSSAFQFYFVGLFFNNFLPANIGGDAVKVYNVTRIGSSVYQVIAVTLLDRLLGIFSLCLLASCATLFLWGGNGQPYGYYLLIFLACMVPAVGFYFVRPLGNALRRLVARIRPLSIDTRISEILDHLSAFKGRKPLMVSLAGLATVVQVLRVFTHILVGIALGLTLDVQILMQFFVFVPLLSLAMIPPITINGLGIREGLGIVLFAAAGLAQTDAFALEFLTYVVSVVVSLVGLGFFLSRRARDRVS